MDGDSTRQDDELVGMDDPLHIDAPIYLEHSPLMDILAATHNDGRAAGIPVYLHLPGGMVVRPIALPLQQDPIDERLRRKRGHLTANGCL